MKTEFFTVHKQPMYFQSILNKDSRKRSDARHFGLVSLSGDDDQQLINRSVSAHYEIHQPQEIYNAFERVAESNKLEIKDVLTDPSSGSMLINALYKRVKVVGDSTDLNVCFFTSHDGRSKTMLTLQALRMACLNQAPVLRKNNDLHLFEEKHYKNALDVSNIERILEEIPEAVTMFNARAEQLASKQMSRSEFVDFYTQLNNLKVDGKKYDYIIETALNVYDSADGQNTKSCNDNAWKAFNAITYMNTHERTPRVNPLISQVRKLPLDSQRAMDMLLAA